MFGDFILILRKKNGNSFGASMIINTGICLLTVLIFIVQNVVKLKRFNYERTINRRKSKSI